MRSKIKITKSIPVVQSPKWIPVALKNKVKEELDRMEKKR